MAVLDWEGLPHLKNLVLDFLEGLLVLCALDDQLIALLLKVWPLSCHHNACSTEMDEMKFLMMDQNSKTAGLTRCNASIIDMLRQV